MSDHSLWDALPIRRFHLGSRRGHDLRRKTFDLLCDFVREPARVLPKNELLDTVWGAVYLHQDSLSQAVSELRRALGDDAKAPRFIETVHGRGYRFIHPIEAIESVATEVVTPRASLVDGPLVDGLEPADMALATAGLEGSNRRWPSPRLLGCAVVYATRTQTAVVAGPDLLQAGPAVPASPTIALLDMIDEGDGEESWLVTAVPALLGSQVARHTGVYVYTCLLDGEAPGAGGWWSVQAITAPGELFPGHR